MLFLQLGRSSIIIPYWLLILVICLLIPISSIRPMAISANLICNKIPGLTDRQRHMCRKYPDAMVAIGNGSKLGLAECQEQFKFHRWNCSSIGNKNGFGHVVVVGSREAAYFYAVWSAGIAYSLAHACSRGHILSCGCDNSKKGKESLASRSENSVTTGWKWGGCSPDISFSSSFAQKFVDSREKEDGDIDARSLMNLHNNNVGRKSVKVNLLTDCKCHGVSGSCTLKTCWQRLPPFRKIGDYLMHRYRDAKRVVQKESQSTNDSRPKRMLTLQLRKTRRPHRKPRNSELVYLSSSPNYCEADLSTGSLGVVGRQCNRTSSGADGCDLLCCGRGYNTHQFTRTSQCRCKFHWCCEVTCHSCSERIEEYTCK